MTREEAMAAIRLKDAHFEVRRVLDDSVWVSEGDWQ